MFALARAGKFRLPPPDGSRDPRIEDPTNRWIVHLAGRALLPLALHLRISANAVSVAGLGLGAGAAWSFYHWSDWRFALLGLALCTAWLIADGLDGMIARATGSASALGRALDGLCDHGVFLLLYIALALSVGIGDVWLFATITGMVHAVQSSLYEGERIRFHRRLAGRPAPTRPPASRNPLVRIYDSVAHSQDRRARPCDDWLEAEPGRAADYGDRAVAALRPMWVLSNNMRVVAIYVACMAGDPRLFWWYQLVPLSIVTLLGVVWHRRVEARLASDRVGVHSTSFSPSQSQCREPPKGTGQATERSPL